MLEPLFNKQKSLEELQYLLQHYGQVYPQAKQQGKIVLRQYFKKLNHQIQYLKFRSKR